MPIDQVSQALGHKSIKITEKHYLPWVNSRQDQMDAAIDRAYANGPMLFVAESKPKLRRVK